MIYCVSYDEVTAHLLSLGFRVVDRDELAIEFERGAELLVLRAPNIHGHIPEMLVNDAFEAAGLDPPRWTVFWCD